MLVAQVYLRNVNVVQVRVVHRDQVRTHTDTNRYGVWRSAVIRRLLRQLVTASDHLREAGGHR